MTIRSLIMIGCILILSIIFFRLQQGKMKKKIVKSFIGYEKNQNKNFFILFYDIQTDVATIQEKILSISFDNIFIIYHGPEWKLNIIKKKIPDNHICIADQNANLFKKLELLTTPAYVEITKNGNVRYGIFD